MDPPKTVVFGLDGAHFEILDPWLQDGKLPNIQQVLDTGVKANLNAVYPPVTSPNWKAYATGKNPGKLGIFWWENIDTSNHRVYYPSDRKHINTEFWELISDQASAGVLGVPTTYPPKDIDSFIVSGAPDAQETGFANPPAIEERLKEELDYRVTVQHRLKDDLEVAVCEIHDLIDLRFKAAKLLLNDWDISFLQVTTFYINALHHFLWDDERTLRGWQIIDGHLGDFLDDDRNVVLMSDHGSTPIRTTFYVNSWLEIEGYLTTDTMMTEFIGRLGINTDSLVHLAIKLGVRDIAEKLVPQAVLQYIPDKEGAIRREQKTGNVDWEHTDAVASGQGPIYLTLTRSDSRYNRLRDDLISKLESLTDPVGRPVADAVYRGEDVYEGPFVDEGPDIVIDQAEGVHIQGSIGHEGAFGSPTEGDWIAENKREGLFAATGPDFDNRSLDALSILDLGPTLLHLHSCPVPTDMDGEVRKDVFAPGSEVYSRPVQYKGSEEYRQEREAIRRIVRSVDL